MTRIFEKTMARPHAALFSLTILAVSCSSEAPKWVEVGTAPDMKIYMDQHVETIDRVESRFVSVKMLWDYNYPQIRSEGEYRSVVVKLLIDCGHGKAADFSYTNYLENMAAGAVIAAGERDIKVAERTLRDIQNPSTKAVADLACKEGVKR